MLSRILRRAYTITSTALAKAAHLRPPVIRSNAAPAPVKQPYTKAEQDAWNSGFTWGLWVYTATQLVIIVYKVCMSNTVALLAVGQYI
jgi:hypothetical protein